MSSWATCSPAHFQAARGRLVGLGPFEEGGTPQATYLERAAGIGASFLRQNFRRQLIPTQHQHPSQGADLKARSGLSLRLAALDATMTTVQMKA